MACGCRSISCALAVAWVISVALEDARAAGTDGSCLQQIVANGCLLFFKSGVVLQIQLGWMVVACSESRGIEWLLLFNGGLVLRIQLGWMVFA